MTRTRRHLLLFLAIIATASLSGCFSHKTIRITQHAPNRLILLVDLSPEANANTPLSVDIVTVTGQAAFNELFTFTAQNWFANKDNFTRLHASQIHIESHQWVPGEAIPPVTIDRTANAAGVLLFANYASPGAHRTVLPIAANVRLNLGPTDLSIQILP